MPLLTSTPVGRKVDRASNTLSGLIPPANSHPCLLLIHGNLNLDQSNPLPLQAWKAKNLPSWRHKSFKKEVNLTQQ